MDIYPAVKQREALLRFAKALGCRDNALRRDENGDWRILGAKGCVYAIPGTLDHPRAEGFQVFVAGSGDQREQWTAVKAAMKAFTTLINDGDDEGALFMGRLPSPNEAETIRRYCGVAKKRELGEEELLRLRARMAETGFRAKLLASDDLPGGMEPESERRGSISPVSAPPGSRREARDGRGGDGSSSRRNPRLLKPSFNARFLY